MDYSPPGSSVYGIIQARILDVLPFPPPRDLFDPGIEPTSSVIPALASSFFFKPLSQILFSLKKEGSSDTGYNMDET